MMLVGRHWHVWRARGPLYQRQIDANEAGCIAALEQHFNAIGKPDVLYATALVGRNGSEKSKTWARDYVARVAKEFGIRPAQIVVGPPRGEYCIHYYRCPSILLEPGFVSNHDFANIVQTGEGIDAMAKCAVDSICEMFPDGGLVALSVGHLYRGTPDSGAPVNDESDEPDPAFDTEGELNDIVVKSIEEQLLLREGPHEAPTDPAPPI